MKSLLSVLILASGLASGQASPPRSAPELTSIAAILAHPASYDGRLVHIKGAAVVRFEGNSICDTPEMIDAGHPEKCLWLGGTVFDYHEIDISKFHKKLVELVGTFHAQFRGHMDAYGGSISPSWGKIIGVHTHGDVPPEPPPPRPQKAG